MKVPVDTNRDKMDLMNAAVDQGYADFLLKRFLAVRGSRTPWAAPCMFLLTHPNRHRDMAAVFLCSDHDMPIPLEYCACSALRWLIHRPAFLGR